MKSISPVKTLFKVLLSLTVMLNMLKIDAAEFTAWSRALPLLQQLRCLTCQGQSVAESSSDFALEIQALVQEKIEMGWANQAIKEFLQGKYGDAVFYDSLELQKFLFIMPFLLLAFLLYFGLYKKK